MKDRILRVNELIKKELAKIILKEIEWPKDVFITLTRAEATKDLSLVKIYISTFPESKNEEVLSTLNSQIFNLQKKLNKKLVMKFVPKIQFFREEKTIEAGKVEEILERLKK